MKKLNLILENNNITGTGLSYLLTGISGIENLEILKISLGANKIQDENQYKIIK